MKDVRNSIHEHHINRGDQVGKIFEQFWKPNIFRLIQHCKVIEKKGGLDYSFQKGNRKFFVWPGFKFGIHFSNVTSQILLNVIMLFSRFASNPSSRIFQKMRTLAILYGIFLTIFSDHLRTWFTKRCLLPEAYPGALQTSKMESFTTKLFILYVCRYASHPSAPQLEKLMSECWNRQQESKKSSTF